MAARHTPAAEPEAGFAQEIGTPGFSDDELRRAQHAYWRSNPTEKRSLLTRVDALGPHDALRALHLHLIDVTAALRAASADDAFFADDDALAPDDVALCRKLVAWLTADPGAPRPRRATVTQAGGTLRGELINPDRDGSTTRFVAHVPAVLGDHTLGLGIGHLEFMLRGDAALFGLGSVRAITFDHGSSPRERAGGL